MEYMEKKYELLPCPFCNSRELDQDSRALSVSIRDYRSEKQTARYGRSGGTFISCGACGATGPIHNFDLGRESDSEESAVISAINAWNARGQVFEVAMNAVAEIVRLSVLKIK